MHRYVKPGIALPIQNLLSYSRVAMNGGQMQRLLHLFLPLVFIWGLSSCSRKEKTPELNRLALIPSEPVSPEKRFLDAIEFGQVETVRNMLAKGFSVKKGIVNFYNSKEIAETYLAHAITHGKKSKPENYQNIIRLIIDYGADVNAINPSGSNIIDIAIMSEDAQVVEMVVSHRDFALPDNYSPYPRTILTRSVEILDILIQYEVPIDEKTKKQVIFDTFLTEFEKERVDEFGTKIHKMPMTKLLLEKLQIDINIRSNNDEYTLLMVAAKRDRVDAAEYFLTEYRDEIDIEARDVQGWTALLHAVEKKDKASAYLLLSYCADKYIVNDSKMNICQFACQIQDKNVRKEMCTIINDTYFDDEDNKCQYSSRKNQKLKCRCLPFNLGGFFSPI